MLAFNKITFPPYVFREYPKWVTLADGTQKIANDQRHEIELIAEDPTTPVHNPHQAERDALLRRTGELERELAQFKAGELKAAAEKVMAKVSSGGTPAASFTTSVQPPTTLREPNTTVSPKSNTTIPVPTSISDLVKP